MRKLSKFKQWYLRGRNIEIGGLALAWFLLFIFIITISSCSPKNGVLKSKCYDSKWHTMFIDSLFSNASSAGQFQQFFEDNPTIKSVHINKYVFENFNVNLELTDYDLKFASTFDLDPRNPKFVSVAKATNPKAYPDINSRGEPGYISSVKPAIHITNFKNREK